jgi:hypothetical protein
MPLSARAMHFPAWAPLDEATRPELIELGQALLLAENVRPTERGGLVTRRGFGSMTLTRYGATTISAGHKLFAHGTAPCVIDGTYLNVYDSESDVWKNVGRVPEADYRMTALPAAGMSLAAVEIAYANGYIATVYRGQVGSATASEQYAYASVVNATTGAVVRLPEQLGTVSASPEFKLVNVASYGDRYFIAFLCNGTGAGGDIAAYYLDTNTAASIQTGWTSIGPVTATWADSSTPAVESLSDRVAIAYGNGAGTDRLTVKTLTIAGVVETRNIATASVDPVAIAIAGSVADTLWVAWNETTSVKVIGIDADAVANTLATTQTIITSSAAADAILLAANTTTAGKGRLYARSGANSYMRGFTTSGGATATDGSQITSLSTVMMGRPRMYSGRYYANFRTSTSRTSFTASNTQGNAVLCDWSEDVAWVRPVANVAPGLVLSDDSFGLTGAGLDVANGAKLYAVLNVKRSAAAFSPSLVAYDFAATTRWQAVAHNGVTYLTGGLLAYFDGNRVAEAGFLSRPATPTTALSGTGITLATGAKYVAVYEEVDGAGNWCVSGISDPSAITGAVANNTITVSTTPLTMSARLSSTDQVTGTRVKFYRTPDGGSPPYYHCGTAYNTTAATVTLADTMSDATLITQAKLYAPNLPSSVGEKFNRLAPPGLSHIVSCNGVLVGARGSSLHHSGQPVDGEETWFSPNFQTPVEGDGEVTALGAQDGAISAFKRRAVYVVPVEPPADNGSSGGFGYPRRLAVDVGAVDGRAVVVTSLGTFFQSERGVEFLSRAQSVEWIGEKVQDTTTSYPICSAATLDPIANVVYFELAASETAGLVGGNGRSLVFDLTLKAWVSTDRRPSYAGVADTPAQSAAIVWDGSAYRYAWLETGGRVRPETSNYYDAGSANAFIVPRVEYPAVKMGLQQRMRVWRGVWLVERLSAAGFKVEHLYDWETAYSSANDKTWTEAQTASKRQLHWTLKTGERQSVRFRVSATAPATLGTGRAFALVGFSLDVAPKQGSTKGTPNLDPAGRQ